jgi:RHS repeat-associated protein
MDLDYQYGYLKIFAHNGAVEYTEFTGAVPSWTKSYIYLGSSQLSTITPNGSGGETTEYNHPDRLGVRTVTNQQSGTSYEQTTLPFGTALNAETTRSESKRFTTYERSARTGLDYAINRTYDNKLGRFTQVDPIGMSATSLRSPQTLNLYTYCGNDPINHVDPDGLFFGKLFRAIGKIFKAFNKILKWVVIVVAVVLIIAAIVLTNGGAMPAFLGDGLGWLLGIINKIGAGASSFLAGAIGVEIGATAGFGVVAGLYSIGTVVNEYIGQPRRRRKRCPPISATATFYGNNQQMKIYEQTLAISQASGVEQGGWIYQNIRTGALKAIMKDRKAANDPNDSSVQINLSNPRNLPGWQVVGTFHTHDLDLGPSGDFEDLGNGKVRVSGDYRAVYSQGVPGLVLTRPKGGGTGYYIYGPTRGIFNVGLPSYCRR